MTIRRQAAPPGPLPGGGYPSRPHGRWWYNLPGVSFLSCPDVLGNPIWKESTSLPER